MADRERIERIATEIVDAAFCVHKEFGPGLLESVYEAALAMELEERGLEVRRQVPIKVYYKGRELGIGFRADLIVGDIVIVEVKATEKKSPVHQKQLLTYLKLTDIRLGFLINFNERVIKDGIQRVVNKL